MTDGAGAKEALRFRCSFAAVWLPRILGASLLVTGLLAAREIDPDRAIPFSGPVRTVIALAAAAGALWLVRGGSEVRLRVALDSKNVTLSAGRHSRTLAMSEVQALDYAPVFGSRTRWMPAVVLADRHGGRWRIPAIVRDGPEMIDALLDRAGRDELRAWADARQLRRRLRTASYLVPGGYLVAAALPLVLLWILYR